VQKAVRDLYASVKSYEQALKQERARMLAYKVNEKKYEEGLISIMDLHTSANLLLAAKVETIGSHMRMNAQRRIVAYYEGTPLVAVNISE
jgi:outer membrane protein